MQTWYLLTKLSHWNVELSFLTHIGIATSYISSLMSNSMFERWFSALLVPLLFQKCYGSHCTEMFFECLRKSFFRNFSKVQCLQHSSKDVVLKISAFCSYEKKKPFIRRKDEGYRLREQKSKNWMSGDYRIFQYWKDLLLKYLKGHKSSSKEIWIFQRKL